MEQRPAAPDGDGGTLETVSQRDVRLLYAADFWDYPRSGALLWRGRRYWFSEAEPPTGVFDIIELTDDAWAVEDARHADSGRVVARWRYDDAPWPAGRGSEE